MWVFAPNWITFLNCSYNEWGMTVSGDDTQPQSARGWLEERIQAAAISSQVHKAKSSAWKGAQEEPETIHCPREDERGKRNGELFSAGSSACEKNKLQKNMYRIIPFSQNILNTLAAYCFFQLKYKLLESRDFCSLLYHQCPWEAFNK